MSAPSWRKSRPWRNFLRHFCRRRESTVLRLRSRSLPTLAEPYHSPEAATALAGWREKIEATLPNLLSPADVTRLQRLLARFVDVIPKEYRNGVQDRQIVIPLEYKEASNSRNRPRASSMNWLRSGGGINMMPTGNTMTT